MAAAMALYTYVNTCIFISRKVNKDKRIVTDFRHLNIRIANNNLVYPLFKDTFFSVR